MNLFKFLKIGLLFAGMALCAVAEQRVMTIRVEEHALGTKFLQSPTISSMLKAGWRITHMAVASGDSSSFYTIILVLESPESKEEKK